MALEEQTVLMVSNRNLLIDAIGAHLRRMGVTVLVAATGQEAIARLSAKITTAIVDAQTPGVQGFLARTTRDAVRTVLLSDDVVTPTVLGPNIVTVRPTQGLTELLSLLALRPPTSREHLRDAIIIAGGEALAGVRAAMEAEGMIVVPAATTVAVEQVLRNGPARVLVLDIMLAGEGGLGTLRLVKEAFPLTEVIVIGPPDRELARHAVDLGAFDYQTVENTVAVQTSVHMALSHALFQEGVATRPSRRQPQPAGETATSAELMLQRRQLLQKLRAVRNELTENDPLAIAIDACVTRAARGDFHCPVGQLYLMDYLTAGYAPNLPQATEQDLLRRLRADGPRRILESIFAQFEALATAAHDDDFHTALQQCRQNRETCQSCPLHTVLAKEHG